MSLSAGSIVEEARRRSGLDDFGSGEWVEPMHVLVRAMNEEGRLHAMGREQQAERMVGLLVNRARAAHWLRAHPEILEERIDDPIVILGLPRTGSTMLHRTLAAAPGMRSLQWWESRKPAPWPGWTPASAASTLDPRIESARAEVRELLKSNPDLAAVHPYDAESPDEEIMLLEHAFMSGNAPAFVHVPSYFVWLESHDNAPAYRYGKQLLQLLQWQKRARGEPGERWVLKTPHHLMHLELLLECFPQATVIHTHRDVTETIPSFASMVSEIRVPATDHVDRREVGEQWCRRWALAMQHYLAQRERLAEDRCIDIWYRDAVADPIAQARSVYERCGMHFSSETEAAMLRWAELNRRESRPSHQYSLDEYGFDLDSLKRDFAAYRRRFIEPRL